MMKRVARVPQGLTTAARFQGAKLHAKVLEAAAIEVEKRYSACWSDQPEGTWFPLHRQGWQATARKLAQRPPAETTARWWTRRGALIKALRAAREEPEVWRRLLDECPALESVEFTYKLPEEPTAPKHFETVSYLLTFTAIGSLFGPTWRPGRPPTHRDLALQVILSGWISDRWIGSMTVSKAIEAVVDAVRTHRREHASTEAMH